MLTDFPEHLANFKEFFLKKENEEPRSAGVQQFWLDRNHPGMGVFHFAHCESISEAEKLRGLDVLAPLEKRVTLPAGQYFVTDLIGCTMFELPAEEARLASPACTMEEAPRVLGTVRDVFFPGESVAGTPLLQVDAPDGEILVPLAEDICTRIDVAARRIEVSLPEGLSELNIQE